MLALSPVPTACPRPWVRIFGRSESSTVPRRLCGVRSRGRRSLVSDCLVMSTSPFSSIASASSFAPAFAYGDIASLFVSSFGSGTQLASMPSTVSLRSSSFMRVKNAGRLDSGTSAFSVAGAYAEDRVLIWPSTCILTDTNLPPSEALRVAHMASHLACRSVAASIASSALRSAAVCDVARAACVGVFFCGCMMASCGMIIMVPPSPVPSALGGACAVMVSSLKRLASDLIRFAFAARRRWSCMKTAVMGSLSDSLRIDLKV